MNKYKLPALIIFFVILNIFFSQICWALNVESQSKAAQTSLPDKIVIGNKEFSKEDVINTFLQGAINKYSYIANAKQRLVPDYIEGVSPQDSFFNPVNLKEHYPWLATLILETNLPNYSAISRWKKPIRISFGLPNDGKPYNVPLYKGKPITDSPDWPEVFDDAGREKLFTGTILFPEYAPDKIDPAAKQIVAKELNQLIPKIAALTGLTIDFVADEKRDPTHISNMRIVLIDSKNANYWQTHFKKGPVSRVYSGGYPSVSFIDIGEKLDTAIHFTPADGQYQVDGFYVANEKNEIEFSVCYIRDDLEANLLGNMVHECIMRSLGFPDTIARANHSILTLWNSPAIASEKLASLEKHARAILSPEEFRALWLTSLLSAWYRPSAVQPSKPFGSEISPEDEFFIRTLYSEPVKPGMTHRQVFKALH